MHRGEVRHSHIEPSSKLSRADAGRIFQHRIEHRLELARRTTDDAQAPRRSRSAARSDSRSSLSRRVFSIAMTACLAKLLTSSICLSVNGRTSWR